MNPKKPHPEQLEALALDPCPWCSTAEKVSVVCSTAMRECWAFCAKCLASGPVELTIESAAERWNRRAKK